MPHPRALLAALAALATALPAIAGVAVETERIHLSGEGKDDAVEWQFRCEGPGRRCGEEWSTLPVPANWQLHGFGRYEYGFHKREKRRWRRGRPDGDVGHYRHSFEVPEAWRGRRVRLVFEGAMTDTEVRVNGTSAGPPHQGGFYPFAYRVDHLLRHPGPNLLEVRVAEESANRSVNRAERRGDYWVFGGIYRPVHLEETPPEAIDHVALDARHDGALSLAVELAGGAGADRVVAQVRTLDGAPVGAPFEALVGGAPDAVRLATRIPSPRPWSAEDPHLHRLDLELRSGERVLHRTSRRFGFRTVEVRPGEGLYVNGRRVLLRGINRHSFWPDSGRATSRAVSRLDAELLLAMNVNAVRTSHYPPDPHFMDAADELGIYVICELAGWHAPYGTRVGRDLVAAMVRRDAHRPSVILWANGNEGGWNRALVPEFARHDLQGRPVLQPDFGRPFGGFDTGHYPTFGELARRLEGRELGQRLRRLLGRPRALVMPTEMLHALDDGGGGAGLADYWELLRQAPTAAGGFIWSLLDEGVARDDRGGALDMAGGLAADGVVGPYREPEGSSFTLREVFSPVQLLEPAAPRRRFAGELVVRNDFTATDLADCRFEWKLVRFPGPLAAGTEAEVLAEGTLESPAAAPGESVRLPWHAPADGRQEAADALVLAVFDPWERERMRWSLLVDPPPEETMVRQPAQPASPSPPRPPSACEGDAIPASATAGGDLRLAAGGVEARFDATTGQLLGVRAGGRDIPLQGPRLLAPGHPAEPGPASSLRSFEAGEEGALAGLEARWEGPLRRARWTLLPDGTLELAYKLELQGAQDSFGIGLAYPEARVEGARWLGRGPHRVWRNRMQGPAFGIWERRRDAALRGGAWDHPERPGYYADLRWLLLDTADGPVVLTPGSPGSSAPRRSRPGPTGRRSGRCGSPFPAARSRWRRGTGSPPAPAAAASRCSAPSSPPRAGARSRCCRRGPRAAPGRAPPPGTSRRSAATSRAAAGRGQGSPSGAVAGRAWRRRRRRSRHRGRGSPRPRSAGRSAGRPSSRPPAAGPPPPGGARRSASGARGAARSAAASC